MANKVTVDNSSGVIRIDITAVGSGPAGTYNMELDRGAHNAFYFGIYDCAGDIINLINGGNYPNGAGAVFTVNNSDVSSAPLLYGDDTDSSYVQTSEMSNPDNMGVDITLLDGTASREGSPYNMILTFNPQITEEKVFTVEPYCIMLFGLGAPAVPAGTSSTIYVNNALGAGHLLSTDSNAFIEADGARTVRVSGTTTSYADGYYKVIGKTIDHKSMTFTTPMRGSDGAAKSITVHPVRTSYMRIVKGNFTLHQPYCPIITPKFSQRA